MIRKSKPFRRMDSGDPLMPQQIGLTDNHEDPLQKLDEMIEKAMKQNDEDIEEVMGDSENGESQNFSGIAQQKGGG